MDQEEKREFIELPEAESGEVVVPTPEVVPPTPAPTPPPTVHGYPGADSYFGAIAQGLCYRGSSADGHRRAGFPLWCPLSNQRPLSQRWLGPYRLAKHQQRKTNPRKYLNPHPNLLHHLRQLQHPDPRRRLPRRWRLPRLPRSCRRQPQCRRWHQRLSQRRYRYRRLAAMCCPMSSSSQLPSTE